MDFKEKVIHKMQSTVDSWQEMKKRQIPARALPY
jgi:hypothetical protein